MQIVFPFSGAEIGGSHVATFALAQALRRDHQRDCVFLAAAGTTILAEAQRLGFKVIDNGELAATTWGIRQRRSPVYALRRLPARLGRIRQVNGGRCIVHCNEINAIQSYGLITKLFGGKTLYHHHALNRMVLPNRLLIGAADAVVAVSDVCRRAMEGINPKKIVVILNPIEVGDVDRTKARARIAEALQIDSGKIWMGFVGNFWRRKRPEFFLQAAAAIARAEPRAHFIFFGRHGEYEVSDLQKIATDLGIASRVTFAGFMMPAEDNIAAIDLLLAPAIDEPFGRTPIEAALLGTPYVATDDAGHAEIGARWPGGRMVPIDATPQAFADATLKVLKNPDAIRLNAKAKAAVAADFALATHAQAIEAIYQRLES
jgi:glycosyltransferase involved in cell wall biosynthesis